MSKFKVGDEVGSYAPWFKTNGWEYGIVIGFVDDLVNCSWHKESEGIVCAAYPQDSLYSMLEPTSTPYNTVSKPEHYNHGEGIECIEYIKQVLGPEGFIAYCRGNLMKYNHRAMYKGKPTEDLEKAEQYLKWSIETIKERE